MFYNFLVLWQGRSTFLSSVCLIFTVWYTGPASLLLLLLLLLLPLLSVLHSPRSRLCEVAIICIQWSINTFCCYFSNYINRTLQEFRQVRHFCISYSLRVSCILLMCSSVHFSVILRAPNTVVVLRCHIFPIFISRSLYNYYITPGDFFTPALADVLSMESEWQQESSSLHDSSQYYDQSQ